MNHVLKKFFVGITTALLILGQSPLGMVLGTVSTAQADFETFALTGITVTSPAGGTVGNTVDITWTSTDDGESENVDIFYCQLDGCNYIPGVGNPWNPQTVVLNTDNDGSHSWNTSSINNGTGYKILIRPAGGSFDVAGVSSDFSIYNWDDGEYIFIDYVYINTLNSYYGSQFNASATVETHPESLSWTSYEWTQNGGPGTITFGTENSLTTTISADQDGEYIIGFTATDEANNDVGDATTFYRDTTAPATDDNVQAGWYDYSATVSFSCDDSTGVGCERVYYTTDGNDPTTGSSYVDSSDSRQETFYSQGTYTVKYRGEDSLGNLESVKTAENTLKIEDYDYEGRDYVDINGDDPEYTNTTVSKSVSVDIPTGLSGGVWTIVGILPGGGEAWFSATGSTSTNITASGDGAYGFRYTATANDGLTYYDEFLLYWDTVAPTSSDNAPVGRQTNGTTVTFTCDDTLGSTWYAGCDEVYYSISGGTAGYLSSPYELNLTGDGTYEVTYYAIDRASNAEEPTNSFTLQIDQTDPTVSVDMDWMGEGDDENLYSTGQSQNVTITTDDNLSDIATCTWTVADAQHGTTGDVSFDDGENDGCEFMNVTATQPGIYTIRVTVTDNAGNSDYDEFVLYYDDSLPVVENLNVTVESYDTIHIAGLASNTNGFSPIERVFYYIDYEDAGNGFLTLSEENATTTTFYDDIDITHLANGTYTLYVRATTQSEVTSEWMSQSFTKTSSPAQTTPPAFVSSTPSNAATHVSVAEGVATVTFDENISLTQDEGNYIVIKRVSDGQEMRDGEGAWHEDNVLYIPYPTLDYNTNYVISVPAGTVEDTDSNPTTVALNIYFSTQLGTAPDITSLSIENVGATDAYIAYTVDPESVDYKYYRVSTTAYSGTWMTSEASWQYVSDLTPNTTYYYQVRFINNGHTVISIPMSFKTAAAEDGIVVHSIARVLNNVDPVVGGTYANGYHFRFYLTINALWEDRLEFKLANWSRTDGGTMAVANNTKVIVSEQGTGDYNATGTTLTNTSYTTVGDLSNIDADRNLGGRQLYLDLFYKIPTGSQGVYTTSFGIQSSSRCIGNDGGPTLLEGGVWQTAC